MEILAILYIVGLACVVIYELEQIYLDRDKD